jgi:hypothetical protein
MSPSEFASKYVYDVSGSAPPAWLSASAIDRITGDAESARLILEEINTLKVLLFIAIPTAREMLLLQAQCACVVCSGTARGSAEHLSSCMA